MWWRSPERRWSWGVVNAGEHPPDALVAPPPVETPQSPPSSATATGGSEDAVAGMLAQYLPAAASNNEFFTGGLGLAAIGFAASLATRSSAMATTFARRYLLITLEVTSKDPAYPWVLSWLRAHGRPQMLSVETNLQKRADGAMRPMFDFVPGPGKHLVPYDGRLFWVDRARESQQVALADGKPWEKVTLTALGRDVSIFQRLLDEAQQMAAGTTEGMTVIYTAWGSEWRPFGHPRPRRAITSVHLGEGVADTLVSDLSEWRDSMEWYHERGIPYRRGYLLHGPPGCGKSSFIFALAGHLQYDICMLSLNSDGLNDDRLEQALSNVPQQAIVLLEDVDAAFVQRSSGERHGGGVSFSGLLNAIDGVASGEQRVVFMTTNFIEHLDPALIRPGRIDCVQQIGYAEQKQSERLFAIFYPELGGVADWGVAADTQAAAQGGGTTAVPIAPSAADAVQQQPPPSPLPQQKEMQHPLITEFGARVMGLGLDVSMAELQGHLLRYKGRPLEAVENIDELGAEALARQQTSGWGQGTKEAAAEAEGDDDDVSAGRGGRRLHGSDVDRMVFNPQEGWEDQIGKIV